MEESQKIGCPKCHREMKEVDGILFTDGGKVFRCTDSTCSTTAPISAAS